MGPGIGVVHLRLGSGRFVAARRSNQDADTDFDLEDVFISRDRRGQSASIFAAQIDDPDRVEALAQHLAQAAIAGRG